MAFLDSLLKQPTLDGEELDKTLQEFFQSQKKAAQEYMQQKKSRMGGANRQ